MKQQYSEMGFRIKIRRKELNKTQLDLAHDVNISNNHLSNIENGKDVPSLETFIRICQCLNTRPDYLLLGSVSSNTVPGNIIDNLQLCSDHDIELIKRLINDMVELNSANRTIE